MKTAIIIHGLPEREEYYDPQYASASNMHWLPWIQKQLLMRDIVAQTPEMPVPYNAEYNAWREMFERFPIKSDTILIGHSCGAGFIVRYLSENDVHVGRVVLVAPWIDPEKFLDTGMFDFTMDPNIAEKTAGITLFASSNDMDEVQTSIAQICAAIPGINVVNFENMGHFCYSDMGTDAFPELLAEAIK